MSLREGHEANEDPYLSQSSIPFVIFVLKSVFL